METELLPATGPPPNSAEPAVTELYRGHALGLIRLAVIMVGDRQTAEDVVQDAFFGLYRRWSKLHDPDKALTYLRSSVLNGCRSALRRKPFRGQHLPDAGSAETAALIGEERREVVTALRGLPPRQREALVLRYFLDLSEAQIAAVMGVSAGTVKSTTSRGLAALERTLTEER